MKQILKYKWFIIGAMLLIIGVSYSYIDKDEPKELFSGQEYTQEKTLSPYIYVDLKGEVKNPGVYKLETGSRIFQLVSLAGGYTEKADTNALNLSTILNDEGVVYIPSFQESFPNVIDEVLNPASSLTININNAPVALLDTLPGIGPSTAQAIIDYIEENSYFDKIEDIMNVPGIGESTFEAIKDLITTD